MRASHSMRCVSMSTPIALASLNHHSQPPLPQPKRIEPTTLPKTKRPQPPQRQPSVIQIERAIGAGIFRDRDPRGSEQNKTLFDLLLSNSIGKTEGSVEKKLRETGEWIIDRAEGTSRSAAKQILMVTFLWVLPTWTLLLLVASGVLKLPFSIPFLENLIM
ncbi:probable NAD(P)H dehydrogenase subunit CRR3, chloroplastic [Vitis riparia]|uniref:probable NAD(P)H dehydrogenase subunit CRR3, chloroplastic n=1 Tax=Vitis riparia TaxID=96939 RepID=UPI00155A3F2E|nr:probable NAD(P)H dehydrogenase subunit CRR3, chloroplastic [Vitis riparia]